MKSKDKKVEDYTVYHLRGTEFFFECGKGIGICAVLSMLFYKSVFAFFLMLPLLYFYIKEAEKRKARERQKQLNLAFLQGVKALSAALNAGYSIENAFVEAYQDLLHLYHESADIMREFYLINRKIRMNITVEAALEDFAQRSGIEDIQDFSEVFYSSKRIGGDLIKVIRNTCQVIEDRLELRRQIEISIAGKKYESGIMNIMPLGIIAYMWFFSANFMAPLYHNITGICIMTVALGVYIGSFYLSLRILDFEISAL